MLENTTMQCVICNIKKRDVLERKAQPKAGLERNPFMGVPYLIMGPTYVGL